MERVHGETRGRRAESPGGGQPGLRANGTDAGLAGMEGLLF